MKTIIFDMLVDMFEKSLAQVSPSKWEPIADHTLDEIVLEDNPYPHHLSPILPLDDGSMRVFTNFESGRFTKPSYQFLLRMHKLGIINDAQREEVMNQLLFSDSRFITLEEVKWVIRNTLTPTLDPNKLAFLDLVLYQQEDNIQKH